MSNLKILKQSNIDYDNIEVIKVDRDNGLAFITYKHNDKYIPLIIQSEYMRMDHDGSWENDDDVLYELLLSLSGKTMTDTDQITTFYDNLEKCIITNIKNNVNKWFPEMKNENIKFKQIIRETNNSNLLKIKLLKSTKFNTIVYDNKNKIVNGSKLDEILVSGSYIRMIYEIPYIKLKKNILSVHFKIHQIKVN